MAEIYALTSDRQCNLTKGNWYRYGKYNTVGAYEYWSYVYDLMNNEGIDQEVAMTKAEEYFVESGQTFSEEKWHLWFNIKN